MPEPRPPAGESLLHPLPLLAISLLLLNDHVLKAAYPGLLTGKLSDFAGLAFFPLLLQGLYELALAALGRYRGPSMRALLVAAALTAVAFSLIKLTPLGGEAYRRGLAALQWPARALYALAAGRAAPPVGRVMLARDPTDLAALPALALSLWVGARRLRAPRGGR